MNKLIFKYGTMGSGKTLDLIARVYHERSCGREVLVCKPALDNRETDIRTRVGLELKVDKFIGKTEEEMTSETCITLFDPAWKYIQNNTYDFIFIDEAQFLGSLDIDGFRNLVDNKNTTIICYGLKTDFRGDLFEGSRALFELADDLIEIESSCKYCNNKALFNMRIINGKATIEGDSIDLGGDEKYIAVCSQCYYKNIGKGE